MGVRGGIEVQPGVRRLVFFFHIQNIHPLRVHLHAFADQIIAEVLPVDIEIDGLAVHRVGDVHFAGGVQRDGIAQQRHVIVIGQQRPFFRRAHAQQIRPFLKADIIGLFADGVPRGVSPALDML